MGLNIKKIFSTEPENDVFSNSGDEFYEIKQMNYYQMVVVK